ncbi:hypothetical protein PVAG01_03507 [Phlyctema vagabunda]|uniref:Uncharacterized protein n=1 Tax=Phlyctema vagabunda TaxID=108571 RepID=A0ABR4PLM0_9HELO
MNQVQYSIATTWLFLSISYRPPTRQARETMTFIFDPRYNNY